MALETAWPRACSRRPGQLHLRWGSVISIVMVALSLGYWAGGQLADKRDASRVLAPLIATAGLLTVLAPLVAEVDASVGSARLGPRLGSLVAAALDILPARASVATVSPISVRLASSRGSLRTSAARQGGCRRSRPPAASSERSSPRSGSSRCCLGASRHSDRVRAVHVSLAALLLPRLYGAVARPQMGPGGRPCTMPAGRRRRGLLALVWRARQRGRGCSPTSPRSMPSTNVANVSCFGTTASTIGSPSPRRTTFATCRFDATNQSAIDLTDGFYGHDRVPELHGPGAGGQSGRQAGVLGLGGGASRNGGGETIRHDDRQRGDRPGSYRRVAAYFGLPEDVRLRVFKQDARRFVQGSMDTYDIVIVDCYFAEALPFQLSTQEFLGEVKARMAPDGVLVYNVIRLGERRRRKLFAACTGRRARRGTTMGVPDRASRRRAGKAQRRNIIVLATDAESGAG